jgi:hypothetical protein
VTAVPTAAPERQTVDGAEARQARLAAAVAGIRRRSSTVDVERVLHWVGSILFPTGLIVILLGWYGASHTSYEFEQLPYLISWGILGAALTITGGFLYFGYWISVLVRDGRRERTELTELLTRLDNRMAILEAVATGTLPASASPAAGNGASRLVATPTGTLVHRRDCSLVAGKGGLRDVEPGEAADAGLKPCKVCDPFGTADQGASPSRRPRPLRA